MLVLPLTYLRPVKTNIFLFFPLYVSGKTVEKRKKEEKTNIQHFWLTPTYLKLTFVSFFFLLFFMNLSLSIIPTAADFHPIQCQRPNYSIWF